jgi:DNA-binding NarL/FixJ family response regulator
MIKKIKYNNVDSIREIPLDKSARLKNISVLIADDHRVVTNMLKLHFDHLYTFKDVQVANSKAEMLEMISSKKYDILLLDILLPDGNGIEIAENLAITHPYIKIIFFTSLCSKKILHDGFRVGGQGFIIKTAFFEELIQAINIVLDGQKYYCRDCVTALVDEDIQSNEYMDYIDHSAELTEREKEVLKLLMDEYHVPEIADKLCLSPRTVETHKKNIMAKFHQKTLVGLIKLVYTKNLIQLD